MNIFRFLRNSQYIWMKLMLDSGISWNSISWLIFFSNVVQPCLNFSGLQKLVWFFKKRSRNGNRIIEGDLLCISLRGFLVSGTWKYFGFFSELFSRWEIKINKSFSRVKRLKIVFDFLLCSMLLQSQGFYTWELNLFRLDREVGVLNIVR